jgi:hypothetical protein
MKTRTRPSSIRNRGLLVGLVTVLLLIFGLAGDASAAGSYGAFVYRLRESAPGQWVIVETVVANSRRGHVHLASNSHEAFYMVVGTTWLGADCSAISEMVYGSFDDTQVFVSLAMADPSSVPGYSETVQVDGAWGQSGSRYVDPGEQRTAQFPNGGAQPQAGVGIFIRPEAGRSYTSGFEIRVDFDCDGSGVNEGIIFEVHDNLLFAEDFDTYSPAGWTFSGSEAVWSKSLLRIYSNGSNNDYAQRPLWLDLLGQDVVIETRLKLVSGGNNYRLPYQVVSFEDDDGSFDEDTTLRITYLPSDPGSYGWLFGDPYAWTGNDEPAVPGTGWWTEAKADYWAVLRLVLTASGGQLFLKPDDPARGWASDDYTLAASATWDHTTVQGLRFEQPWDSVCLIDWVLVTGYPRNSAPVADAGAGVKRELVTAPGTVITLDGTASFDPDGDELSFAWSAAGITFDDAVSATPTASFPLGTTVVTLTVMDPDGETDTDTVAVTVQDTTPPAVACSADPATLWPPDHKMVRVTVTASVTDASGTAQITGAKVSSDEPVEGTEGGATAPDWANVAIDPVTNTVTLDLRSERRGTGDGRIYTIVLTATDASSNPGTATCQVSVPVSAER